MKKINKKYLIYWVNIILLMLNTALLVFFCFTPEKTIYKNEDSTISNEFLRKELDFTDEQYKLINELDSIVLRRHHTFFILSKCRAVCVFNALCKCPTDVAILFSSSKEGLGFASSFNI